MEKAFKWVNFFDKEMMLRLDVPEGWQVGTTQDFLRLYLAPEEAGFQANLGMNVNPSNEAKPEAMDRLLAETDQEQQSQDKSYRQTGYEKVVIDGNPARLRYYERRLAEPGREVSQVQALILKGALALVIDAACLKELEAEYLPVFERMIKSIRFVEEG